MRFSFSMSTITYQSLLNVVCNEESFENSGTHLPYPHVESTAHVVPIYIELERPTRGHKLPGKAFKMPVKLCTLVR